MSGLVKYHPAYPTELWAEGKVWIQIHEEDSVYLAAEVEQVLRWALPLIRDAHSPLNHSYIAEEKDCQQCRDHYEATRLLAGLEGSR
jgi:hypothetical protein